MQTVAAPALEFRMVQALVHRKALEPVLQMEREEARRMEPVQEPVPAAVPQKVQLELGQHLLQMVAAQERVVKMAELPNPVLAAAEHRMADPMRLRPAPEERSEAIS